MRALSGTMCCVKQTIVVVAIKQMQCTQCRTAAGPSMAYGSTADHLNLRGA